MKYYYSINPYAFYTEDMQAVWESNGFILSELTEISEGDYTSWFNPPAGMYGTWVHDKPVLANLPEPDYVLQATQKRDSLLADMQTATYTLNMKLNLGRTLTDAEKTTLNAWLDYADLLNALDLSTAPDINWPEVPSNK
jgi:hypothetical protein